MNKTTDAINEKTSSLENGAEKLSAKAIKAKGDGRIIRDLIMMTVGILFARCHIICGAFPLGISILAAIHTSILPTMLGCVIGSLTMGESGIIYAVISVITVALRCVSSIGAKDEHGEKQRTFHEGILLRISVSVISGFISAVCEILISGFTAAAMLYSVSMILLPPLLTYVLSGLFDTGFTLSALISATSDIFSLKGRAEREIYNCVFFQCSLAVASFLIALSLADINVFGISASFVFLFAITLGVAKRFGAPRAMALGFIGSLGVSGMLSVSFALAGLISGLLFPLGLPISLLAGGAAACGWGAFSSGMSGLLSVLPEYAIAALITYPLLRGISRSQGAPEEEESRQSAKDVAGVFALSYRNKFSGSLDALEGSLASLSSVIRGYKGGGSMITEEDCVALILDSTQKVCSDCDDLKFCTDTDVSPTKRNIAKLADKLLRRERILADDINTYTDFCKDPSQLADEINMRFALLSENKYRAAFIDSGADQYDLIGKLISDARGQDRLERSQDQAASEALTKALCELGFAGYYARVFGERRKHFIVAMEDEGGESITSEEVRKTIEEQQGVRLGVPDFYRKEKVAVMECEARRVYAAEVAVASSIREGESVSGDTMISFESSDDYFYALCSDGMGSGEEAKRTSEFVGKFINRALNFGGTRDAVFHLLNNTVRSHGRECSATVDLFQLDLLDGSATFIKSGAAPSFVKRDSSIFRIRSGTAPIGLMKGIDSERIRVEVKGGDLVIMMSDGVCQSAEDAPWLLELLSKPAKDTPREYADHILSEAKEKMKNRDDMTVAVIKIIKLG